MISKGHTRLSKFCIILGLSFHIVRSQFVEHVMYLKEKAFELRNENFKMAATQARNLIIKENNLDLSAENVNISMIYDGTWCSSGWTASRVVVTTIAEMTA